MFFNLFCACFVTKILKDSDAVAQSDGEENPAAGEQLLGEVLTFLFLILMENCAIYLMM